MKAPKLSEITVCTTDGFLGMADDSTTRPSWAVNTRPKDHGCSRWVPHSPPSAHLIASLDPEGIHVLVSSMLHNGVEVRSDWMVKVEGKTEPVRVTVDTSFGAFERFTETREVKA